MVNKKINMDEMKRVALGLLVVLALVLSVSYAAAALSDPYWKTFTNGERIDFCVQADRVCGSSNCIYCVNYENEQECYNSLSFNQCDGAPGSGEGDGDGDGDSGGPDLTAPSITLHNPIEGQVYSTKRVLLDVELSERAKIEYLVEGPRANWREICRNGCMNGQDELRLEDGPNKVLVRAIDKSQNVNSTEVNFIVDSSEPRILGTEPRRGYSDGSFTLEVQEANIQTLKLYVNGDEYDVDPSVCVDGRRGKSCTAEVDLSAYDGEEVNYYFMVEDIAGSVDESRPETVKVDMSDPVINNIEVVNDGRSMNLRVEIDEPFLESVEYIDLEDERARPRSLCRRLDNGVCEGRLRLKDGDHTISIMVYDEAGNAVGESIELFTDTTKPRIMGTEPRRGFANGEFYVEFREENPENLTLNYGTNDDMRNAQVNLEECTEERRGMGCWIDVDLADYDGMEIEYYFELTDRVGNVDVSRANELDVDISNPIVNEWNYTIDGSRVYFTFNLTEENFDEIVYLDLNDPRARERRLCSRLRDDVCETRENFRDGLHDLQITVYDEAGNSVGLEAEFETSR